MNDRDSSAEYREDDPEHREREERRERDEFDRNPSDRGKWISAAIALLGLWMVVEALLFDLVAAQVWNDVIVGVLLVAIGGYNYTRRADQQVGSMSAAVLAALLGLWLIGAPLLFGSDAGLTEAVNAAGFWNDVVVGVLALVLGAYSAYEIRDQRRETGAAMS